MATSRVILIKRKKQSLYQLDYSVDGRRVRQTVGPNKRDAELVRAKIQSDLLLGKFQIGTSAKRSVSLEAATEAFLKTKKNRIKSSSLTRYQNYFARLQTFFTSLFPPASKNIRLIQPGYLEDFIENAINPQDPKEKPWSEATVNDGIRAIIFMAYRWSVWNSCVDIALLWIGKGMWLIPSYSRILESFTTRLRDP